MRSDYCHTKYHQQKKFTMSNPKVLMFGWEYAPYFSGGLGIVTRSIIQSLKKQGLDITFVLPRVPIEIEDDFLKIINASQVKIETLETKIYSKLIEIDSLITPYTSPSSFKQKIEKLIKVSKRYETIEHSGEMYGHDLFHQVENYANRAASISRENPHNVIHTHDWMTARAGLVAKEVSGQPMIMHVHASEFERSGGQPNQQVYDIEKEGMYGSDRIIAVSELTKQRIIKNYGVKPEKIHVVHNAIDKFKGAKRLGENLNKTDKLVLFLGRLTLQKGADYLLEAAEKVLRHKKRVKFVFIGNGDMLEDLIKKTIDLGIEKKVMFAGFMSHEEVDRAYQMADVYVMPSVSEPFGITTLEAIQNGTPVIVSKQSGVSEVIQNALKVDFWDVDELANQILAVIRYNPLSKLIAKNAEKELKKMNWDKQTEKIVNVYQEING